MLDFRRDPHNPLLSPEPTHLWEAMASFNGSIVKNENLYHLFYRALSKQTEIDGKKLMLSSVGYAKSENGTNFTDRTPLITPAEPWERYGCEDPRATFIEGTYVIFYTALSEFPPTPQGIRIAVALSKDLKTITERHLVTPFNAKAMTLFPEKINGKYAAILTAHTDMPPSKIGYATFDTLEQIWDENYWRDWYMHIDEHLIPLQRMNSDQIEVGAMPIKTPQGWLMIYAYIYNYFHEGFRTFRIEAVLLDSNDPRKVIGRVHESLLTPQTKYEHEGMVPHIVFPSGALLEDNTVYMYYGAADTSCCRASAPLDDILKRMRLTGVTPPKLTKYQHNPILEPIHDHAWESEAVLNPAAFYDNGIAHIVYRAISNDGTSSMGYAQSKDGFTITERLTMPIYLPRNDFEIKAKPNVGSGAEDPRITVIGDTIYVLYTAYDGVHPPRVAMSSIKKEDFHAGRWLWREPVLISPPGIDDKDACIFPDKINDKYVIFHRIDNDIVIDYVDSLEQFDGHTWLRCMEYIPLRERYWEAEKVGLAAPPIKTEHGWFMLYHGVGKIDHEYRVGAMLLDLEKPSKVISRLDYPLLEPQLPFERYGLVPNVVFPCGNIVIDKTLFVYYGGADKVVCVATIPFDEIINQLLDKKVPRYLI